MSVILKREYELPAAHQLTAGVPAGHPCSRLHGHNYGLKVEVSADISDETDMVVEYAEIDDAMRPILDLVDHRYLNQLGREVRVDADFLVGVGLGFPFKAPDLAALVRKNPTAERIAQWLFVELNECFPKRRTVGFLQPHVLRLTLREDGRSEVICSSR